MSNEDYSETQSPLPVPANDPAVRFISHRRVVKIQEYRCTNPKCRAVDYLKLTPGEVELSLPMAVNCWKCHGGLKVQPVAKMVEMIAAGRPCGMIPNGPPVDQDAGVTDDVKNEARAPMPERAPNVLSVVGNGNNTPH